MSGFIGIDGARQVARGLAEIAVILDDRSFLDVAHRRILPAAVRAAPVATGRLAGSGTTTRDGVTFTASHARPVHWGVPSRGIPARPFILTGAQAVDWLTELERDLQAKLDKITGGS